MGALLAQIGFDPEIRGILVVAAGAIVLFGSVWLILATNQGIRLASLISLAAFFGWMVIMGGFWWIRGIGFVGESVSWEVLDYNRADISQSSVERARNLPDPELIQGLGFQIANLGMSDGVQEMAEFVEEVDPTSEEFADMTADELAAETLRQQQRNSSTTLSQVFSVAPDFVEQSIENGVTLTDGSTLNLDGWTIMTTAEAGEAQATAGAEILETDAFDFDSQAEFRFLDAFRTGGKPRIADINRDNDLLCTFCTDNLERGWLWVRNSARITHPTEYAVVQLQAIDQADLITPEGQAPPFPELDESQPIVSVIMVRELGNLRFPPAVITIASLLIFVGLCYMLHLRDRATMARVQAFEAES